MNSQVDRPEIKYDNLLDYFNFYLLPLAIKIGMTPYQFWEDDPNDFFAYWDAYEMKKTDDDRESNINAFNQGHYFLLAMAHCFQFTKNPKKIYPKQPLPLSSDRKVELSKKDIQNIRKTRFMWMENELNKTNGE